MMRAKDSGGKLLQTPPKLARVKREAEAEASYADGGNGCDDGAGRWGCGGDDVGRWDHHGGEVEPRKRLKTQLETNTDNMLPDGPEPQIEDGNWCASTVIAVSDSEDSAANGPQDPMDVEGSSFAETMEDAQCLW